MTEVDEKVDRVARFASEQGLAGVMLSRQPNFAWLAAGQSNRIDGSVDAGSGALLVTSAGERHLVANTIEMPRLRDEALRDLGFAPAEYPWAAEPADAAAPLKVAQQLVRGTLGSDVAVAGAADVSSLIAALQTPLTSDEIARYRQLGREMAVTLEGVCRALQPGLSELDVAAQVDAAVARAGARSVVTLVGSDERIARFRHPVPTAQSWQQTLLVGLCAERQGLVVALSRLVSARPAGPLNDLTHAAARVFAALLAATQPGITGAQLFKTAQNAYRHEGHEGEERLHHQGGAIGYRSRDWLAHLASADVVHDRQAFAWNPSITGTKVEDTALLLDGRIEIITATGEWPRVDLAAGDHHVTAAGVLEL